MHHALDVLDVPASTTAALIFLFQQLTTMLQNNDYVLVVSTDFSRAFDTVRHQTPMHKMAALELPDHIYNWMAISPGYRTSSC